MSYLIPWAHIIIAVSIYIIIALLSSKAAKVLGSDLKKMEDRTSHILLYIGAIANGCILILTLILLRYFDNRAISSIGVSFSKMDISYIVISFIIITGIAVLYSVLRIRTSKKDFQITKPVKNVSEAADLSLTLFVLLIVAIQEEVLFRGYITLNLISYSPLVIIIVTTIIFAAIHLLTNHADIYQITSWMIGGMLLSIVYLISGSIWVPIALHFIIDLTNVLVFNIAGKYSIFTITPNLTKNQSAFYRILYAIILIGSLLILYGPFIQLM